MLTAFQIDRHNDYRELDGFFFPSHEDSKIPMFNTLVDGELVLDTDPVTKKACCLCHNWLSSS
jgi:mRNA guanylyltransferase